jgi:8-amino-7-oxononanoate synthase
MKIVRYTSITDIPLQIWNDLAPKDKVGLESGHLKAIEISGINSIKPYYLIGYWGEMPVAIAYCFVMDLDLAKLGNEIAADVLTTLKTWYPEFMNYKILECGFISGLGTAIIAKEEYLTFFLDGLNLEFEAIGSEEQADFCLIRDIPCQSYRPFEILRKKGYQAVPGFPVSRMIMPWNSFEEYLAALRCDKRQEVKKKMKQLAVPEISVQIIQDFGPYAEQLAELWKQVADRKNDYEHEHLTKEYFEAINRELPDRSHIVAICKNKTIIAFALCFEGDEEYFWAYVGMDYQYRDTYSLYFNLVFQNIKTALKHGKKVINMGITSYDFKLYMGCELDPQLYFVKHLARPELTIAFEALLRKGIVQPENHHHCFKNRDISERVQLKDLYLNLLATEDQKDIFHRTYNFDRPRILESINLYAYFPAFESAQEPVISYEGREIIMMGTNCYLGLSTHPEVKQAAKEAIDSYGTGCSGSPILNGTLDIHGKLAKSLADFMHKDAALIFSTGYQTNLGVISTLAGKNDIIIMDERNHASIVDGALLSKATIMRFRHNNMSSLEKMLQRAGDSPKLIVVDSLFSMEGTVINLPEVVQLARKYKTRLMLDESHAIGVIGLGGRGVAEYFGLMDEVDIIMGTFSKSLAAQGGFVAADRDLIYGLRHSARSHIFSASLSPAIVAAVQAALNILIREPERRQRLLSNAHFLAEGLVSLGYQAPYHGSAIVPIFCGNELLTLALFHKLFKEGVFVNPVINPAVPKNQEMLRLSLMPDHTPEQLAYVLETFKKLRTDKFPASLVLSVAC